MEKRRQPEIIAGRVNADGSIAVGDEFAVTKGTAGQYTVILAGGFRARVVTATIHGNGSFTVTTSLSGNTFGVGTFVTTTGAATDAAFSFIAVGIQQ